MTPLLPRFSHLGRDPLVSVLASGSKGNCSYVGDGRHGVLVDCGLATKQIFLRLRAVGLEAPPIDGVLITHEHADHIGSARILDDRIFRDTGRRVPFFATAGTFNRLGPETAPSNRVEIEPGQTFPLADFTVEPFTVSHDVADPVAYAIQAGPFRAGFVTDLGIVTRLVANKVASLDFALLEFNHDEEMLLGGSYPWPLKQRIRGPQGHLSNDQGGTLLEGAARAGRLRTVVLGHLSEENNTPEKAWMAARKALHSAGRRGIDVHVACQSEPIGPFRFAIPHAPCSEDHACAAEDLPCTAENASCGAEGDPCDAAVVRGSRSSRGGP